MQDEALSLTADREWAQLYDFGTEQHIVHGGELWAMGRPPHPLASGACPRGQGVLLGGGAADDDRSLRLLAEVLPHAMGCEYRLGTKQSEYFILSAGSTDKQWASDIVFDVAPVVYVSGDFKGEVYIHRVPKLMESSSTDEPLYVQIWFVLPWVASYLFGGGGGSTATITLASPSSAGGLR